MNKTRSAIFEVIEFLTSKFLKVFDSQFLYLPLYFSGILAFQHVKLKSRYRDLTC